LGVSSPEASRNTFLEEKVRLSPQKQAKGIDFPDIPARIRDIPVARAELNKKSAMELLPI